MSKTVIKTTSEFEREVRVSVPTGGKTSVQIAFTAFFKSQPNDIEVQEELEDRMEEIGIRAFLDEIMPRTEFSQSVIDKFEFQDDEGNTITPDEWARQNKFASNAASAAFWKEINKDLEGKSSRRSRRR